MNAKRVYRWMGSSVCVLAVAALALALPGCGGDDKAPPAKPTEKEVEKPKPPPAEKPAGKPAEKPAEKPAVTFEPAADANTPIAALMAAPTSEPTTVVVPPGMEHIKIDLPKPRFSGTPKNIPATARLPKGPPKPRPPFVAPKGTTNLALKKRVTASDMEPVIGTLDMITDDNKEAAEDSFVELGPGPQWVQIDLGKPARIYGVALWHEHKEGKVYYDVVIQVADDKDFIKNVQTIFNNDHDNTCGQGLGKEMGYLEDRAGLLVNLVESKGVVGRYIRFYSNGNTSDDLNRYTEVAVYAIHEEKP